jgi:Carbohydrate/starch-binding module (family 21)
VIYTTDRWVHAEKARASFREAGNAQLGHPNEVWDFSAPLGRQKDFSVEVRFALRYQVDGKVYWDDNVGLDYVLTKYITL